VGQSLQDESSNGLDAALESQEGEREGDRLFGTERSEAVAKLSREENWGIGRVGQKDCDSLRVVVMHVADRDRDLERGASGEDGRQVFQEGYHRRRERRSIHQRRREKRSTFSPTSRPGELQVA
jgi:hypothetical protein